VETKYTFTPPYCILEKIIIKGSCYILRKCGKVKISGNDVANQNNIHDKVKLRLNSDLLSHFGTYILKFNFTSYLLWV